MFPVVLVDNSFRPKVMVVIEDEPVVWGECQTTLNDLKAIWAKEAPLDDPVAFAKFLAANIMRYKMQLVIEGTLLFVGCPNLWTEGCCCN